MHVNQRQRGENSCQPSQPTTHNSARSRYYRGSADIPQYDIGTDIPNDSFLQRQCSIHRPKHAVIILSTTRIRLQLDTQKNDNEFLVISAGESHTITFVYMV